MDDLDRLIQRFRALGKPGRTARKLDLLMDLERLGGERVVEFLRTTAAESEEPAEVRLDAMQRLREMAQSPEERRTVAETARQMLGAPGDPSLRLQAALVLGDVVDEDGVLAALGAVAQDADAALELRYNAFTSLQRAGPTPEVLALLQSLSSDETLGPSVRALIAAWGGGQR